MTKCFPARVYATGQELPDDYILPGTIPTLISEPVVWEVESRCFVSERQLVTLSVYARYGELAEDENGEWSATDGEVTEAEDFVRRLLADTAVQLPRGIVVDVGRMQGRGWGVIEANAAWSSGLYGCNAERVLDVICQGCLPVAEVGASERQWVIERRE